MARAIAEEAELFEGEAELFGDEDIIDRTPIRSSDKIIREVTGKAQHFIDPILAQTLEKLNARYVNKINPELGARLHEEIMTRVQESACI